MKRPQSLSVADFTKILDTLCATATQDLRATRARMDALRSDELPPG
jgi:hypothetical protein